MKNMKRVICWIITVMLIINMLPFAALAADGTGQVNNDQTNTAQNFTFVVEEVSVPTGTQEVVVPVYIKNNPGFIGGQFYIEYDDNLKLTEILPGVGFSSDVNDPSSEGYEPSKLVVTPNLTKGFVLLDGTTDVTTDGELLKLKFEINDPTKIGNYTISINTDPEDEFELYDSKLHDLVCVVDSGSVTVGVAQINDGICYQTFAEAVAAAKDGDEVKIYAAGTYTVPSGKNIAITGAVAGVVFDNIGAHNMGSANVTFNNVTFDYYPNVNYTGLQHSGNLVYNNCTINGQVFLYGVSETFNNCTFNQNSADAYNVWTYGAKKVAFNECTFNSAGKSVLIYSEQSDLFNDVTVTKSTFNATSAVDGKAAIEMDSSLTAGIKLTIDAATTATGFGSGNVSGNSLWNNKKGNNTDANNDISVVVNGETVLGKVTFVAKIGDVGYEDLHAAMIACKAGETVKLVADVDLAGSEWEPVSFKGTFDGQDHKISNLTINKPGVSNVGFITSLNGTFKNVTFTNPTVTGGECTGVVAGRAGGSQALAENITVNGTIKVETTHSGYARAGVIVGGWAYGNYKNITVDGGDKAVSYIKHTGGGDGRYVAGIVGHADDVESYVNCTVKNITISGGWLCGGIAGPGPADGIATGCAVENIDMGANYSGGMFGWYFGDGTIEDSTIKNVAFTGGTTNNGAIGGYSANTSANVSNVTIENVTNGGKALLEHVAQIDDKYYFTFADALAAAEDGDTITLISGNTVISMAGSVVGNKTITITGSAIVDWTKGNLFIGRGGAGDGKVIFDGANITSYAKKTVASTGIHVSGSTTSDTVNNGVLVIKNSNIEVDYLINRNEVVVEGNSTLTVYGGCYTHGRNASESSDGTDKTATLTIESGSTVVVVNENGMGVGGESNGVMTVKGTYKANNLTVSSIGLVTVDGGTLEITGTIKNAGANTTFKNATVKAAKLLNSAELFIEGENTIQIEDVSGSTYAVRVRNGAIFNNSYMPGGANETVRLLGSATFNGGFKCAYLQGAGTSSGGVGGTVTIEDGTTVEVSYGVEFSNNYVLNGGTIKLSGGNASGKIWGCVFQDATFEINTDIVVESNGATAPIHFTNATATINSDFSQSNPGGEVVYMTGSSVTVTKDASITSSTGVHVNAGATLKSEGTINAKLKSNAGTIEISGGTYTQDVSEWCVDGFICEKNADGTYGVRQQKHLIIHVGSTVATTALDEKEIYVATMDEAVAAANAAGADYVTYKISGPVELTTGGSHGIIDLGKNVTIEGVTSDAKLTIVGGGVPDFKGVTFKNITLADEGTYLPTANEFMYQNYIDCTFEKVTFEEGIRVNGNTTITNCTINSNKNNQYALWSDGGKVTMTGSTVIVDVEGYGMVKSDNATEYVLTNNKFEYKNEANKEALNTNGAKITASNNTFIGCTEGIIPTDKTNYAADGTTVLTADAIVADNMIAVAKIGDTYYKTIAEAINVAKAGDTVKVFAGTYAVPSMKAGITIEGIGDVLFEGTLTGTLENLTLKNIHIKGGNAQRWAYAKGNLVFENVTFEATSVYALHFDGVTEGANLLYKECTIIGWAAMSGSPESCVFDGCTIKDNGTYGVIRTYFDATINNCTFDVKNANPNDVYQDGIHAVSGAEVTVDGCTNANGDMKDLVNVSGTSVVVLDGVEIKNVAKIGDAYYTSLADAVAAAQADETITLLSDIVLENTLNIPAGKKLAINLNGYTISGTHGSEYSMIHVLNGAELTVEGDGKISYAAGGNNTGAAVWVEGKLTLNGGTIEVTGTWTLGFAVDVRPNAWGTAHTVPTSFEMNGGTVKSTDTAVRVASNSSDSYEELGVTFTMNGGSIESDWDAIFVQHLYVSDLDVKVVDGTVSGKNSVLRIYGDAGSDIDIIVEGGNFDGAIKVADAYVNTNAIAISDGTYTQDVAEWCARGFRANKIGENTWSVDEGIIGDISGDGIATSKDVVLLRQYVAKLETSIPIIDSLADVTGDGIVSSKDIVALRQLVAGIGNS